MKAIVIPFYYLQGIMGIKNDYCLIKCVYSISGLIEHVEALYVKYSLKI